MTIEDELTDAMAAHVAGVQAPPDLGGSVRRRNRSRVLRFRVAGAALVTAAVAVAVPVALNSGEPAGGNVASGQNRAVMQEDVTVPDVTGKTATEATEALRAAGLLADLAATEVRNNRVTDQKPAAGQQVTPGSHVELTLEPPPVTMPQDLGDLGDGREFGGIRLDYLPEGLEWGKWSGKDGFGKRSYTTTFDKPGNEPGHYSVQVIVFEDAAAKSALTRFPEDGAESVDVGGEKARLATLSEGGEIVPDGSEEGTLTIAWKLRDGLAVEVCLSPDYVKDVDGRAEAKKIAEGIRATG
ncbi:PASTA domain-containing protein [Nonomuraea sp. NPDC050153]|uniref:PASTA domain-containing protein n=1 Tax=Nonomuraea sp. NPDC050153 TaxID=3364359 RepID=UPI0037A32CA7